MSFDRIAAAGRALLTKGVHHVEVAPEQGESERWGISVMLQLADSAKPQLSAWTSEAMSLAGDHHWATGSPERVHITVRPLAPRNLAVEQSSELKKRAALAVEVAAQKSAQPQFEAVRLLVSPTSVMLGLESIDRGAERFAASLTKSLGDDTTYEGKAPRQIWYSNLLHFAGPVTDPQALLSWVEATDVGSLGTVECVEAALVEWRYDGGGMTPVVLASSGFAAR